MQQKAEIDRLIAGNQKKEAAKVKGQVGDFSYLTQHLLPVLITRNRIQSQAPIAPPPNKIPKLSQASRHNP